MDFCAPITPKKQVTFAEAATQTPERLRTPSHRTGSAQPATPTSARARRGLNILGPHPELDQQGGPFQTPSVELNHLSPCFSVARRAAMATSKYGITSLPISLIPESPTCARGQYGPVVVAREKPPLTFQSPKRPSKSVKRVDCSPHVPRHGRGCPSPGALKTMTNSPRWRPTGRLHRTPRQDTPQLPRSRPCQRTNWQASLRGENSKENATPIHVNFLRKREPPSPAPTRPLKRQCLSGGAPSIVVTTPQVPPSPSVLFSPRRAVPQSPSTILSPRPGVLKRVDNVAPSPAATVVPPSPLDFLSPRRGILKKAKDVAEPASPSAVLSLQGVMENIESLGPSCPGSGKKETRPVVPQIVIGSSNVDAQAMALWDYLLTPSRSKPRVQDTPPRSQTKREDTLQPLTLSFGL